MEKVISLYHYNAVTEERFINDEIFFQKNQIISAIISLMRWARASASAIVEASL